MVERSNARRESELDIGPDPVVREAAMPFAQCHAQLDAGEMRPEAPVNTSSEGEVPIRVAIEVDRTRIGSRVSSRLAAPMNAMIESPFAIGHPSTSVARIATRARSPSPASPTGAALR